MGTEELQPHGRRFFDRASQREMILVADDCSKFNGWLCYRHPDGQWITLRKATEDDLKVIAQKDKNLKAAFAEYDIPWPPPPFHPLSSRGQS